MLKRCFQSVLFCFVAMAVFATIIARTDAAGSQLSRFTDSGTIVAVNKITVDASTFDPSNEFFFRGFNVSIFENNGTSYSMITSTCKEITGCGKVLEIDPNTYSGYQDGKAYKLGYRILYSFSEEDSEVFILNQDNGSDGWTPIKANSGKDVILFLYTQESGGLKGSYFNHSTGISVQELNQVDGVIDYNWGTGSPSGLSTSDNFNVIWKGYVIPKFSGKYKFIVNSDDGMYLKVTDNGIDVEIKDWACHGLVRHESSEVDLVVGQRYGIELRYFENTGSANVSLCWSAIAEGLAESVIPQGCLSPDSEEAFNNLKITEISAAADNFCIGDPLKCQFEATAVFEVINPTVVIEKELMDGGSESGIEIRPYFINKETGEVDKSKFKVLKNGIEIAQDKYTVIRDVEGDILVSITDSTIKFSTGDLLYVQYLVNTMALSPTILNEFTDKELTIINHISECFIEDTAPSGLETIPPNNASSPTVRMLNGANKATEGIVFKKIFRLD